MSGKGQTTPETFQSPGYSYVDDRPGIAHVTDIPPAGAVKVGSESKKPVVDFLRAMWKPSLREPAPLQNLQMNEMPVTAAAVPDVMQIEATLHDSLLPSQREMSAELLSNWDTRREPTVIPAILHAAGEDGNGAKGSLDCPLRLPISLALFGQTGSHFSRPGEDLPLRTCHPGVS